MVSSIYVNLPIQDVERTRAFFTALGFTFNPKFTDDKALCLVLGDHMYAMLVQEEFFKTFTEKKLVTTASAIEAINALQVESKAAVEAMVKKAVAAGGKALKPSDLGWMYDWGFEDLDGHSWDIFWQDESQKPA